MDFCNIYLSKAELKALRRLDNEGPEQLKKQNHEIMEKLYSYGLVGFCVMPDPPEPSDYFIPKEVQITDRGKSYLNYLDGKKRNTAFSFIRQVVIGAIGALVGALATYLLMR